MKIKDTIIVAGTPRSGSTWIMSLLGQLPGYTTLFEPLHPNWFPGSYKAGFRPRTYIPPRRDWSKGEKYLAKVFKGNTISKSAYFRIEPNFLRQRLLSDKLIVKFVRANRILPWMYEKFNVRATVFIIRHPCAVISSQLQNEIYGYANPVANSYKVMPSKKQLMSEISELTPHFPEFFEKVIDLCRPEEILAAIWCIDNFIPLSSEQSKYWYILPYEKLVSQSMNELKKLFSWLEENIPEGAKSRYSIKNEKNMKGERKKIKKDSQLSKWKKNLDKNKIDRILRVVSDFGLDFYTKKLEPDYDKIKKKKLRKGKKCLLPIN